MVLANPNAQSLLDSLKQSFDANAFLAEYQSAEDRMAVIRRHKKRLQKEQSKAIEEHAILTGIRRAMDKMIEILNGNNASFHDGVSVSHMRSKIKPDFFVGKTNVAPVVSGFKTSQWFDFRGMPPTDKSMADFGKELMSAGIARLPFDQCVFVLPYIKGGEKISACYLVSQDGMTARTDAVSLFSLGKPVGMSLSGWLEKPLDDGVYYAVAAMASKNTETVRRSVATGESVPSTYKGDAYTQVRLRGYDRGDAKGGTHASPRLHWRRGHIRHLAQRTTWVRPTLVGSSDAGIIAHDYVAAVPTSPALP